MLSSRATFVASGLLFLGVAAACSDVAEDGAIGTRGKDDPASGSSDAPNSGTTPDDGTGAGTGTSAGTNGSTGSSTAGSGSTGGTSGGVVPKLAGPLVAYAGGYGPNVSIYSVNAATGALTAAGTAAAPGGNPSFLAVNATSTYLYAVSEGATGQVSSFSINPKTGALTGINAVSSKGNGPAHVVVDATGKWVVAANYGDGVVAVLPVQANGGLGEATDAPKVGTNAHQVVFNPSNKFVFVPCKGSDYVAQFRLNTTTGKLEPNATPTVASAAGAGPRHLAFHPKGKFAYVINELNNTVTTYSFDGAAGRLTTIESTSTLPAGFAGGNTTAEVYVHPSGKYVLGSNRGHNSIVVYTVDEATGKLTLKGHTPTGGNTPRSFGLNPLGALLYAANQDSGSITAFKLDATGAITAGAAQTAVTSPAFIGVVNLPTP